MNTKRLAVQSLPRIVTVEGRTDHGICWEGVTTANCPHCGAGGRYIYHLVLDDGSRHGAMKGCFLLFPMHPLAKKVSAVFEKLADYKEKGYNTPNWMVEILDINADFVEKKIDLKDWEFKMKEAFFRRSASIQKKYGKGQYR